MSDFTIANCLTYEDLGHDAEEFDAYSPDYDINDIGSNLDLTISLLGYQLDTEAIKKLIEVLNQHVQINNLHEYLRLK